MKVMSDMFGTAAQEKTVNVLAIELSTALAALAFHKHGHLTWHRSFGWKLEEIDVVLKGGLSKYILPSFRVRLPLLHPTPLGEMHRYVAQINVARFLRPEAGPEFDLKVPSFALKRRQFVKTVLGDVLAAIHWFDEFETPQKARESLDKYLKPGCTAHEAAVDYLESLSK